MFWAQIGSDRKISKKIFTIANHIGFLKIFLNRKKVSEIMDLSDKTPYKKTPIFNAKNVPKAILEKHNTKEGVWGKLIVNKGRL